METESGPVIYRELFFFFFFLEELLLYSFVGFSYLLYKKRQCLRLRKNNAAEREIRSVDARRREDPFMMLGSSVFLFSLMIFDLRIKFLRIG